MDILNEIRQQLGGPALDGLAQQIGAGRPATEQAVGAALPMLIGGLAKNANRSPEDARSLAHALDRDHDPSLLEQLGGALGGGSGGGDALAAGLGALLGGGGSGGSGGSGLGGLVGSLLGGSGGTGAGAGAKALDGAGILRHVFGERRGAVEGGVAKASGLDSGQIGQLLMLLAPIVMSALAKVKQHRQLDDSGLAATLDQERQQIETQAPGVSGGGLSAILDRDHDGDISDDLASMGAGLAKAFFSR